MKKQCKKLITMLVAVALVLTSIAYQPTAAKAAEPVTLLDETGVATANTPVVKSFNVTAPSDLAIAIYAATPATGTVEVRSSADNATIFSKALTENDWLANDSGTKYLYLLTEETQKTDVYTITINFAIDVEYQIVVLEEPIPYISSSTLTVTKGFSSQLTITNPGGDVTWTSSDASVASVDATGKVTGKKAGTAVVTAQLADGSYCQCNVTVENNVYSRPQASVAQTPAGHSTLQIYNVSYKNGNLVIKARFLNNLGRKVTQLKNVKVTIKNANGKVIGTYSAKKIAANVNVGQAKNYTFTIKKAKLKQKKTQDLTKITTKVSGKA